MSEFAPRQRATAMYSRARDFASSTIAIEIKWSTVGMILFLGFFYMITSAIGMSVYSKCESMKGKPVQENLNKYLAATLTIGLTIPFTLLVMKLAKNQLATFMLVYSILGIVGSAAALNWTVRCNNAKKSEKTYSGLSTALFSVSLLAAIFMLRPKKMAAINTYE
jgi:hypothetical protein